MWRFVGNEFIQVLSITGGQIHVHFFHCLHLLPRFAPLNSLKKEKKKQKNTTPYLLARHCQVKILIEDFSFLSSRSQALLTWLRSASCSFRHSVFTREYRLHQRARLMRSIRHVMRIRCTLWKVQDVNKTRKVARKHTRCMSCVLLLLSLL